MLDVDGAVTRDRFRGVEIERPMVRISTPHRRRSPIVSLTSSRVSPRPTMIPDLVSTAASSCLAWLRIACDQA